MGGLIGRLCLKVFGTINSHGKELRSIPCKLCTSFLSMCVTLIRGAGLRILGVPPITVVQYIFKCARSFCIQKAKLTSLCSVSMEESRVFSDSPLFLSPYVNSAFHPSGIGSLNRVPASLAGVKAGCVHLCRVPGNPMWRVTLRQLYSQLNGRKNCAVIWSSINSLPIESERKYRGIFWEETLQGL